MNIGIGLLVGVCCTEEQTQKFIRDVVKVSLS